MPSHLAGHTGPRDHAKRDEHDRHTQINTGKPATARRCLMRMPQTDETKRIQTMIAVTTPGWWERRVWRDC